MSSNPRKLRKSLRLKDLILLGLAATIGAGIFSTVGKVAYGAGTGSVFLFIFISITCLFCALCYAEFASRIPNAGGAYAYVYAVMGKMLAWIVGWSLILEYSVSNSVLLLSWSAYFQAFMNSINCKLPLFLSINYSEIKPELLNQIPHLGSIPIVINLPAIILELAITFIVYRGLKGAISISHTSTLIKLGIVILVLVIGAFYVDINNWKPILPHGVHGLLGSISAVFFAFIGFDALGSTAEECQNPKRDLPRAIVYTLLICLILYSSICLVIIGMVGSEKLNVSDPLAFIFQAHQLPIISNIVTIGSLIVIISAIVVYQIAQPRIWFSMSRDQLLAPAFSKIHPKFRTPSFATIMTGISVAIPIIFVHENTIIDLTSIGTLFAFSFVCIGVLFLPKIKGSEKKQVFSIYYLNSRYFLPPILLLLAFFFRKQLLTLCTQPKTELLPIYIFLALSSLLGIWASYKKLSLIPTLGVLCCLYLLSELGWQNWVIFLAWNIIGFVVFFYGKRKWQAQIKNEVQNAAPLDEA